jgi:N-methylhydantoinase A
MGYRIGVDIGGTFTDCVVVDEGGERTISKSLTTRGSLQNGVLDALAVNADSIGLSTSELLARTTSFVHGTTQATNAMLERGGARTGLITTHGHEDSLIVGRVYSKMAGLHERDLVHSSRLAKPIPIIPRALIRGVNERIDRDGDVVVALDEGETAGAIESLIAAGVESLAVSFLWSFVNDRHERQVQEIVGALGLELFTAFSCEVAPVLGEYERTATTAVTAYIGPKVVAYLEQLEERLHREGLVPPLLVMQASGGLTSVQDAARRPIVTLDSGPTGGILGSRHLGRLYGESNIVCTDVGGTSFDVGLILAGEIPMDHEPVVAQYSLRMPKVLVATIGAGGGSICWIDEGGLLRVGPQSAGSSPGPACYGFGGTQATITDADVVLGYLDPDNFLGGRMRLDREAAVDVLASLGAPLGLSAEEAALGVFRIINSQMADLIGKSTIELGHDPRDCIVVAYGGAGPTHACFYGAEAGTRAILVPQDSTVFSAEGMLTCDISHSAEVSRQVASPFSDEDMVHVGNRLSQLEQQLVAQFEAEGAPRGEVTFTHVLGIRFTSQVNTVDVVVEPGMLENGGTELTRTFHERYAAIYGQGAIMPGGQLEIEQHRVVGVRPVEPLHLVEREVVGPDPSRARKAERKVYFEGHGYTPTSVFDGSALRAGHRVAGPAIIERMGDSVVVPPDHEAAIDSFLTIHLTPAEQTLPASALTQERAS